MRCSTRRQQRRARRDLSRALRHIHADILPRPVGRLAGKGPADAQILSRHVLVRGQHNVKVQLTAYAPALIFIRGGHGLARAHVALETAVVYAHGHICPRGLKLVQRAAHGGKGVADPDALKIFRRLPLVYIMRDSARQPDAQSVFQRDQRRPFNAAHALDVCAQAHGVQLVQIALYLAAAIVEVVVAQRHEVIPAHIHYPRRDAFAARGGVDIARQRAALKRVAAVNDQRVPIVGKAAHTVCKAAWDSFARGVIRRGKISVCVACVVNGQIALHDVILNPF